jgi:hypothetical protein
LCGFALACLGGEPVAGKEWPAFLEHRTRESFDRLQKLLRECESGSCGSVAKPDSSSVVRLVGWVKRGDARAIHVAFMSLRYLDGGDLEDVMRSLGGVADTSPGLFLREVYELELDPRVLRGIVVKLPEAVFDDKVARRNAIQGRIQSLSTVTDPDLRSIRDQTISDLRAMAERHK